MQSRKSGAPMHRAESVVSTMHLVRHESDTNGSSVDDKRHATTAGSSSTGITIKATGTLLRCILIDLPLLLLFCLLLTSVLIQHVYLNQFRLLVNSFRRKSGFSDLGFYNDYQGDFTYYNRQCTADDITTTNANDLFVTPEMSSEEAAHVMMKHGAVMFQNVLSNQTAMELREYLEKRNVIREELPWHEKFWEGEEGERLALGLGAHDDPVITKALHQVGTHPVVKKTIEALMGEDPAIVEISTMTSMYGAPDQGIHSDSDYFGSSNLYSRNFLHSYTMFMALQDTTSKMGATTICAGTHHCANPDLEDVCLDNGAFEVSSNGITSKEDGVLKMGDAMMFNQNVWHRGAENYDDDHKMNRVMFIITFLSRTKDTPGDYRQQAWGTYYYQRWNMWGHTYNDLKNVQTIMSPYLGALRALGLWKPKHSKWGITWLEQVARQMANHEDFYDPYELPAFVTYMDSIGIPKFLQGGQETYEWESFFEIMFENWVAFLAKVNLAALGIYIGIRLVLWTVMRCFVKSSTGAHASRQLVPSFVKRLVLTHAGACLLFYGLLRFMDQSDLARRIQSGEVFVRPFPEEPLVELDLGPTTMPEREDVLVGTRFDADFLGAYNDVLDYHPGNIRLQNMLADFENLPRTFLESASRAIVKWVQEPVAGVEPRFLFQDPANGYWTIMPDSKAMEYVRVSLLKEQNGLYRKLGKHLAQVLSDSRFGASRETIMSQRFAPLFVQKWEDVLFGTSTSSTVDESKTLLTVSKPSGGQVVVKRSVSALPETPSVRQKVETITKEFDIAKRPLFGPSLDERDLKVNDRVLAVINTDRGQWEEGILDEVYENGDGLVYFVHERRFADIPLRDDSMVQRYEPLVEGDIVEAEVDGRPYEWNFATIVKVHPQGLYSVQYESGETEYLPRYNLRPVGFGATTFQDQEGGSFQVGQRVFANYKDEGEWFEGTIASVYDDLYEVEYDDGDFEYDIPVSRLRPLA